jgi:hypothetical protein
MNMRFNKTLWVFQATDGALFLFAGSVKLVLPLDQLAGPWRCQDSSCDSSVRLRCLVRSVWFFPARSGFTPS